MLVNLISSINAMFFVSNLLFIITVSKILLTIVKLKFCDINMVLNSKVTWFGWLKISDLL